MTHTDPLDGLGGEYQLNHKTGRLEPMSAPIEPPPAPVAVPEPAPEPNPEPEPISKTRRGLTHVDP